MPAVFQTMDTNSIKPNNVLVFRKIKTKMPLKNMFEVHFTHRKLRLREVSARSLSPSGVRKQNLYPEPKVPSHTFPRGCCRQHAQKVG